MHYGFITPMIWPRGTIKSSKTRPVVVPKMAHHEKNRSIKVDYIKSGWSVSQAFNECLSDILKLTPLLLVDPKPVLEDEIEDRWKWFKMAHHEKNRSIKVDYIKSGWSVSQAFNECLSDILKLTPLLLVDPKPVLEDEIEDRWKWFKMAHHEKNRSIKVDYIKSGWSVSQAFNECLSDILKLTPLLLVDPKPVLEDEIEDRWKWFKILQAK
ncbi:uncharacterized protein [Nicotiana tomentosiformis]|uniref:uncharacterized protein isoform X3 n=1 Tax=Nicotiana tomentosiformis TaxID=4098 RepID=UPI00388CA287